MVVLHVAAGGSVVVVKGDVLCVSASDVETSAAGTMTLSYISTSSLIVRH